MALCPKEALMMALYGGGRPGSSRRVRLVPVRHSSMDHRAVARIVLALARQMAAEADETVDSAAVDEVVSSGVGACARSGRGTSDGQAAARDDAAVPWAGAHSGQSARSVASVGRCTANEPVSASPGSCLGRCSHQRHDGARYLAHGSPSATSHVLPDRVGAAETDEATAASSTPGGTP